MTAATEKLAQAVIHGDAAGAVQGTHEALSVGNSPLSLFQDSLIPAMRVVGERMATGEYYLPEVLLSARAMRAASDLLRPLLVGREGLRPLGRIVIGTVEGDLHDIGKNLVAMMLEGNGFEVIDLGTGVPAEQMVRCAMEKEAQIVGLSALLTTTMVRMKEVIQQLAQAGGRPMIKVMVGGAPMTQRFADQLGADGYAVDAPGAVALAKRLLSVV